jgi:hypothetical protein
MKYENLSLKSFRQNRNFVCCRTPLVREVSDGAKINDRSCLLPGGKQCILGAGYQRPLDFKNGLPYLCWRKPTETELSSLPHIIMTLDVYWDPRHYDITFDEIEQFHDTSQAYFEHENFDQYGECQHWTVATYSLVSEEEFFDDITDTLHPDRVCSTVINPQIYKENKYQCDNAITTEKPQPLDNTNYQIIM